MRYFFVYQVLIKGENTVTHNNMLDLDFIIMDKKDLRIAEELLMQEEIAAMPSSYDIAKVTILNYKDIS